jgi:hypothetical protein
MTCKITSRTSQIEGARYDLGQTMQKVCRPSSQAWKYDVQDGAGGDAVLGEYDDPRHPPSLRSVLIQPARVAL